MSDMDAVVSEAPGQYTREMEITTRRIERAREELAAERRAALEPERRCEVCDSKLTVQVFPHSVEAHCTPCERRARFSS